jgi:hypothetical protein
MLFDDYPQETTAEEVMETVRNVRGKIWVEGDILRYEHLPTATAKRIVPVMRELKQEIMDLLALASWDAEIEALYLSIREEQQEQGRFELERLFNIQP